MLLSNQDLQDRIPHWISFQTKTTKAGPDLCAQVTYYHGDIILQCHNYSDSRTIGKRKETWITYGIIFSCSCRQHMLPFTCTIIMHIEAAYPNVGDRMSIKTQQNLSWCSIQYYARSNQIQIFFCLKK